MNIQNDGIESMASIDLTCFAIEKFRFNLSYILQYFENHLFNIRKNKTINVYIPLHLSYPRVFLDTRSIISHYYGHIYKFIFRINRTELTEFEPIDFFDKEMNENKIYNHNRDKNFDTIKYDYDQSFGSYDDIPYDDIISINHFTLPKLEIKEILEYIKRNLPYNNSFLHIKIPYVAASLGAIYLTEKIMQEYGNYVKIYPLKSKKLQYHEDLWKFYYIGRHYPCCYYVFCQYVKIFSKRLYKLTKLDVLPIDEISDYEDNSDGSFNEIDHPFYLEEVSENNYEDEYHSRISGKVEKAELIKTSIKINDSKNNPNRSFIDILDFKDSCSGWWCHKGPSPDRKNIFDNKTSINFTNHNESIKFIVDKLKMHLGSHPRGQCFEYPKSSIELTSDDIEQIRFDLPNYIISYSDNEYPCIYIIPNFIYVPGIKSEYYNYRHNTPVPLWRCLGNDTSSGNCD